MVDKCIDSCSSGIVSHRDLNRCLDGCPENERYNYKNVCYDVCPSSPIKTAIDNENKKCYDNKEDCLSSFSYYEDIGNNYICRKECPNDKFINGSECVEDCKYGNNVYIGSNNKCITSCSSESIRKYRVKYKTIGTVQIYNCSLSCGDQYTHTDTLYCDDSCSNGYYTSPNKYCYPNNCDSDKDYNITTTNGGKPVCSKRCYGNQYFLPPNKCVNENECLHEGICPVRRPHTPRAVRRRHQSHRSLKKPPVLKVRQGRPVFLPPEQSHPAPACGRC